MYVVINNKPYAVKDNKFYEVSFGEKGTIVVGKEVNLKNKGKFYTYDEIRRKFNLKALLQAKDVPTKELVDELNKKINELIKENKELKAIIEEFNKPADETDESEDNADNSDDIDNQDANENENEADENADAEGEQPADEADEPAENNK